MTIQILAFAGIDHVRPVEYPQIDIDPVFIQYMFSFIVILLINLVVMYQFGSQLWQIYKQADSQHIIHDIYDKIILQSSFKYITLNILCIVYFHDLTSPPVQIFKVFWLLTLVIVFMKFDVKDILLPAIGISCGILMIPIFWIWIWSEMPVFKMIFVQCCVIIYYGLTQAYRITKILTSYFNEKHKKTELSVQSLLQKNNLYRTKNQYDQFTTNLQLDEHIIGHLQNRRSFCIVFSMALFVNVVLYMNLQAGKQLLGQVLLSLILDIVPLYIVFWYLKTNIKEKQKISESQSVFRQDLHQLASKRTSKIVIQMVNLKS